MEASPRPTIERVKALLRRDLKLGPDAAIPDDMPLIGGHLDLDSLDVLLVITTIEKEFGVKAPADGSAKEVFKTVRTLVDYLDGRAKRPASATITPVRKTDPAAALARLPHRDPFRFVSRLEELNAGVSGRGVWVVTGREAFFAGHFPDRPIVPGVLLAEALAQLSGIVAASSTDREGVLGESNTEGRLVQVNVRYHRAVEPPAEVALQTGVVRTVGWLTDFEVRATVDGQPVADGKLTLSLVPSPSHAEAAT